MREPYALKGARTVPGRGEGGNTLSLFDGGASCFMDNTCITEM